jgi:NAD(P)-dependent dehydrogenase (short-subunit alcohol dehydrogenase family)
MFQVSLCLFHSDAHELAADQGAVVTAHYNSNYTPLKAFEGLERRQAVKADLTNEQEVIDLFNVAQATYGPVQILIINHAISVVEDADLWDMSLDRWQTTINTNLTSSFLVAREYLRNLKIAPAGLKEEAAIVLIGSTAGKYGKALSLYSKSLRLTILSQVKRDTLITPHRKAVRNPMHTLYKSNRG